MTLPPRKLREIIVQLLFAIEMGSEAREELIELLMQEVKVTRFHLLTALEKAEAVLRRKEILDEKLKESCHAYNFSRIGAVERNILRLGLFELLFEKNTASDIIISEAIRLNKKFATTEGASLIHALLDTTYKSTLPPSEAEAPS